jgi:SNF2 family DNA or RNA helicase
MLELRFASLSGRVDISCDQSHEQYLHGLRNRFATSAAKSNLAFDVDLDDFLLNLRELSAWPSSDVHVTWEPALRRLVESNAADAQRLRERLSATVSAQTLTNSLPGPDWFADLTDFQRRDLAKLWELNHGANFSVPGAGKTRVTLALFHKSRVADQLERMLVICPKSAFESWENEVLLCFPNNNVRVASMDSSSPPLADVVLVNYERLPDCRTALMQWLRERPSLLVLDEAHRMKLGPAGAWGRACYALGPCAAKRHILTGTPAPNGQQDLENLFSFVWPGQGRSTVANSLVGGDLRAASIRLKPLFTRTTKKELDLPPVETTVRRLELPPLHRELYNALLGQLSGQWKGGERDMEALGRIVLYLLMAGTSPALLATGSSRYEPLPYRIPPISPVPGSSLCDLMRDLPHYELSPKYQEVLAIVASNAALGRKTLVWSTFVRNLTSLESLLAQFKPALIHGSSGDRREQLARFRQDPDCQVLLSNPATLGEGVSLHHVCHDAVYVDRDFAAGRFLQSLDRIHRLGLAQDVETRVTVLIAQNTLDELVEQRLALKLRFMGSVLDDETLLELGDLDEEPSIGAGMDQNDLTALTGYLSKNVPS